MAALRVQSFRRLVRGMAQAMQGAAERTLDFTPGSVARAWIESVAGVALWLQWLILETLRQARAATCVGRELDTWMADYGLARLPAVSASGDVILSRNVAGRAAFVPEGATIKTGDGTLTFYVTADEARPGWRAEPRGYAISARGMNIAVPVRCVTPGAAGNVQAGTITMLTTPLAGLDAATNPAPFANGADAEGDDALRSRFVDYINSLSRATRAAVTYAVRSVDQGLSVHVAENVDTAGAWAPGNFVVTVDDGTGNPPPAVLARVRAAVDPVRGLTTTFSVRGPANVAAHVSLTLAVAGGGDKTGAIERAADAIAEHVNALGVGAPLLYGRLYALAYGADASITGVTGLLVNGGTADIGGGAAQTVRLASLSVT